MNSSKAVPAVAMMLCDCGCRAWTISGEPASRDEALRLLARRKPATTAA
jgi:hypothetical protein